MSKASRLAPAAQMQRDAGIAAARAGGTGVVAVAERFGVSPGTVSRAVQRHQRRYPFKYRDDDMQWADPSDYAPQTPGSAA